MSEDLDEMNGEFYRGTVQTVKSLPNDDSFLAKRALLWIGYATKPLSLEQLMCAILEASDIDVAPKESKERLLAVCSGLIRVEVSDGVEFFHPADPIAHEAIHKILVDEYEDPHGALLATCLQCIFELQVIPDGRGTVHDGLFRDLFVSHPFLAYAYHSWHVHAKLSSPKAHNDIAAFILGCKSYPQLTQTGSWHGMLNPVHIVALLDLPDSISDAVISASDSEAINSPTAFVMVAAGEGTPLMLAARGGREYVVRRLLERPDLHLEGEIGSQILMAAVRSYQPSIVDILLADRRIDATRKSSSGIRGTALFHTQTNPDELILSKLLEHRPAIDINARHFFGRTVLGDFVRLRRVAHVRRLLEDPDVDVNAKDTGPHPGASVLQHAVNTYDEEIVKLVMSHPKLIADQHSWEWRRALELTDTLPSSDDDVYIGSGQRRWIPE